MLAPVLVFLTVGVADMGRAFFYEEAVTNTTRQVIRLAVLSQNGPVGDFACQQYGGDVPQRSLPDSTGDVIATLINQAANESSNGTTPVLQNSSGNAALDTKIKLNWNCKGGAALTNSTVCPCPPGTEDPTDSHSDSIRARVDYSFQLITPLIGSLLGGQTVHIRADERGRAEY